MIPADSEITLQEGDTLSLECRGEGELQFSTMKTMPQVRVELPADQKVDGSRLRILEICISSYREFSVTQNRGVVYSEFG